MRAVFRLRCGAQIQMVIKCRLPTTLRNVARPMRRLVALFAFVLPSLLSFVALLGFTTTAALACACGCSVFDVGGLDTPQEQDHGGRVFFEFWSGDQTENWVGSSKAPARPQFR